MIIIGLDPGSQITGYAVLQKKETTKKNVLTVLEYGAIKPQRTDSFLKKIVSIHKKTKDLFKQYKPNFICLEKEFLGKYPRPALALGHVRGAIMTAVPENAYFLEYEPKVIKKAITGSGNASKEQVSLSVSRHLRLVEIPKSHDITDALAIAYCCSIENKTSL